MPIEEKEKLFLNTLSFEYPKEPVTFYFSLEDRTDCRLTKLNHLLFPSNIKDIFPKISNSDTLYTSFDYKIDGLLPLEINFSANNFFIAKRYYNRQIKYYFNQKGILVEPTFIKDNQIWLQNKAEKAPKDCAIYDRYTIKVNFNHFFSSPELVVSFDRPSKVLTKSVSKFLSENDEATADLFNRVVYIEYFQNENGTRTTRRQVTKYEKLKEVQYALTDMSETEYLDCINFLSEAGYITVRNIETKEPADIADTDYSRLEAKVTAHGIRLLGGEINDKMVKA